MENKTVKQKGRITQQVVVPSQIKNRRGGGLKTLINRFWHEQLASVPQRLRFAYPSGEFEKWHPQ